MNSHEACETLKIDKRQLAYLVKQGKIAVQMEGEERDYFAEDVQYLAEQSALQPGKKLSKMPPRTVAFNNERVNQARRELIEALKDACLSGRLTRDEAQGRLSVIACNIFESVEPVTWKLPSAL
jgi:hypothetical protein